MDHKHNDTSIVDTFITEEQTLILNVILESTNRFYMYTTVHNNSNKMFAIN